MLSVFYRQGNPGVTLHVQKSEKKDKAKIREILAPHLPQRFLAKLSPIVKSELKISDFVGCFIQATKKLIHTGKCENIFKNKNTSSVLASDIDLRTQSNVHLMTLYLF